jgi:hypothetical protein
LSGDRDPGDALVAIPIISSVIRATALAFVCADRVPKRGDMTLCGHFLRPTMA